MIAERRVVTYARGRALMGALVLGALMTIFGMGCKASTAVSHGRNPALDGADLVKMTDDIAMLIAGDPQVQRAINERGSLRIVVQPVENRMTGEVLPPGASEAFTGRVRTLLSRHAPDRFVWIMNRDAYYRLRDRSLEDVDVGPNPDAINPEFALTAIFSSLANVDPKRRTSYYLCVYELTSLADRTVLWSGKYEVKKTAVRGFLD